jgi:hypothetical protein
MRTYWSNTKIADWIRGTTKPASATSAGWHKWEKDAKENYPIRYWIVEEAFDSIQKFVRLPIDTLYNAKYYINNRWVTRTHSLTAHAKDIKPGQWQDVGNRFLPCLFNELVDFVEIETAWQHIAWDDDACKKYNPPFYAKGWFRWRTWRSAQAGLDHLDWAASLDNSEYAEEGETIEPTSQATSAKEIKELYLWWTQTYRNRVDPMEASGWSAYCEKRRQKAGGDLWGHENETEEERKECMTALDLSHKIEAEHMAEDEAMLIRLIKIRQSLWT